ncbi:MAG: hypothetical protein ACE5FP_03065 [Gemmatimonadota bacterium]
MNSRKLTFEGAAGDQLAARLDTPDGSPTACALFAHCFTCSKDLKAVGRISDALTAEGIGVLRFDFTGLGESEGEFADTSFASNVDDLVAAARFLEREVGSARWSLAGWCGGHPGGARDRQRRGRSDDRRAGRPEARRAPAR